MRIALAADHNGFDLKTSLLPWLQAMGHEVRDLGTNSTDVVDYPHRCLQIGQLVTGGAVDRGIVLGGSGQGEQIACNKVRGVRAGLCHCRFTTEISRAHNDANVMVIGAKVVGEDLAKELVALWLDTPFKGGVHQQRLDQIAAIEDGQLG